MKEEGTAWTHRNRGQGDWVARRQDRRSPGKFLTAHRCRILGCHRQREGLGIWTQGLDWGRGAVRGWSATSPNTAGGDLIAGKNGERGRSRRRGEWVSRRSPEKRSMELWPPVRLNERSRNTAVGFLDSGDTRRRRRGERDGVSLS